MIAGTDSFFCFSSRVVQPFFTFGFATWYSSSFLDLSRENFLSVPRSNVKQAHALRQAMSQRVMIGLSCNPSWSDFLCFA